MPAHATIPLRPCPTCGRAFRPPNSAQRCCPRPCGREWRYAREGKVHPPRACLVCGASSISRNRRATFCSVACARIRYRPDERFDRSIERCDAAEVCWLWRGPGWTGEGYGRFAVAGVNYLAHRFAYERAHGPIPPGLLVCHHCDTPACCNPDHPFLGTNAQNTADKVAKGRQARGTATRLALLEPEEVPRIRDAYAHGAPTKALAGAHGVTRATIRNVVTRLTWKHLA